MSRILRRAAAGCAATALAIGGTALGTTPAASATPGDLACVVSSDVEFDPGLTLKPTLQTITYDVSYSGCTSLTGSPITSGNRAGSFQGVRSCLALPPSGNQNFPVHWNTNQTSTVTGTTQSVDVAGQTIHTITGSVTNGPFTGDTWVETVVQPSLSLLDCLDDGVTSQSGTGALVIS
jgi:hypothetical protein